MKRGALGIIWEMILGLVNLWSLVSLSFHFLGRNICLYIGEIVGVTQIGSNKQ